MAANNTLFEIAAAIAAGDSNYDIGGELELFARVELVDLVDCAGSPTVDERTCKLVADLMLRAMCAQRSTDLRLAGGDGPCVEENEHAE